MKNQTRIYIAGNSRKCDFSGARFTQCYVNMCRAAWQEIEDAAFAARIYPRVA